MPDRDEIREKLKECYDPEIPVTSSIRFTLITGYSGGYVYKTSIENEKTNPDLVVNQGDTVIIELINGQSVRHGLVVSEYELKTQILYSKGDTATLGFSADTRGRFPYYCSVGGHRNLGMEGTLIVR